MAINDQIELFGDCGWEDLDRIWANLQTIVRSMQVFYRVSHGKMMGDGWLLMGNSMQTVVVILCSACSSVGIHTFPADTGLALSGTHCQTRSLHVLNNNYVDAVWWCGLVVWSQGSTVIGCGTNNKSSC